MIRELTRSDIPALQTLFDAARDYFFLETGSPADLSTVEGMFARPSLVLGLFVDEKLIGKVDALFGYPAEKDCYLGLMIFAPEARGLGYGKQLLQGIETEARKRGSRRLLVAPLEDNPRGRAFWKREGFVLESTIVGAQYSTKVHTVLRMTKILGTSINYFSG